MSSSECRLEAGGKSNAIQYILLKIRTASSRSIGVVFPDVALNSTLGFLHQNISLSAMRKLIKIQEAIRFVVSKQFRRNSVDYNKQIIS